MYFRSTVLDHIEQKDVNLDTLIIDLDDLTDTRVCCLSCRMPEKCR